MTSCYLCGKKLTSKDYIHIRYPGTSSNPEGVIYEGLFRQRLIKGVLYPHIRHVICKPPTIRTRIGEAHEYISLNPRSDVSP